MKRYLLALTAAIITAGSCLYAQKNENQTLLNAALHGWEYEVRAGISIGGSSPLPLPAEIRSIDSYNPTLAIMLEGNAIKWFGAEKKWGLTTGLRLETKHRATTGYGENYGMEIIGSDGNRLKGNWTGGVRTKLRSSLVTIPLLATHKFGERWSVRLGLISRI